MANRPSATGSEPKASLSVPLISLQTLAPQEEAHGAVVSTTNLPRRLNFPSPYDLDEPQVSLSLLSNTPKVAMNDRSPGSVQNFQGARVRPDKNNDAAFNKLLDLEMPTKTRHVLYKVNEWRQEVRPDDGLPMPPQSVQPVQLNIPMIDRSKIHATEKISAPPQTVLSSNGSYRSHLGLLAKRAPQNAAASDQQVPMSKDPALVKKLKKQEIDMMHITKMAEMKLNFFGQPRGYSTYDVYEALKDFGTIVRITLPKTIFDTNQPGSVTFRPPPKPKRVYRLLQGLVWTHQNGTNYDVAFHINLPPPVIHRSPIDSAQVSLGELILKMTRLDIGTLQNESNMTVMCSIFPLGQSIPEVDFSLQRKIAEIRFSMMLAGASDNSHEHFKINIRFSEISKMLHVCEANGEVSLVLPLESPPFVYRKTSDIAATHDTKSTFWDEKQAYFRETSIFAISDKSSEITALRRRLPIVDIGRWLCYRFVVGRDVARSDAFQQARQTVIDHNIEFSVPPSFDFTNSSGEDSWWWLSHNQKLGRTSDHLSDFGHLKQMAMSPIYLVWPVRYMLEVCISQNIFHESSITKDFLEALVAIGDDAVRLLEKAVDLKQRIYQPSDVFSLQKVVKARKKKIPHHCATVCAVTITPSTMYFAAPIPETSNRIVREFRQYEDRFLRVKFTDERYRGAIMSADDFSQDQVYERVHITMSNGILVGDRHFEFLAYGNSQFREHGAYFFASAPDLTVDDIRRRMGTFDHIRVIAKYAARLGQCFSTTRAMPIRVRIERIPDIIRNNYTFTDGVGRISSFLAQMVAEELGILNSSVHYPSIIQFRLGGCKGVLAVDPALKGNVVHIRPSQEKFNAAFHGLEVCRVSQFSSATLNMQIILVLEALGVPAEVFRNKMREALERLDAAMTNERRAIVELSKNVDFNQTSLTLAQMIRDGFMEVQDPFTMSCLNLWRVWTIKYLKEKARIFVEKGALVLGCIDETSTLKGHFDKAARDRSSHQGLPEIFLQISDLNNKGRFKIIEGLCILGRNPSLHPGDIRVVKAIDVPALHHLKDCVVLPQTGDRDLANMCSGGDLDGDDYLVIWDPELLPSEWNHEPQDYEPPPPVVSDGPVSIRDIVSFFVSHMKHSNLPRIAVAHRYWADWEEESVKTDKCLRLAALHSQAVDYAKTGVPAEFPKNLRVSRWPHWSERMHVSSRSIYHSRKVLGQLYDMVNKAPFMPTWDQNFDDRILKAFEIADEVLAAAREIKTAYDEDVRRVMNQYGIKSEFEVWTTWILEHNQDRGDYKLAESFGEVVNNLRQQYQSLCYEKVNITAKNRDWEKLAPFIAAMYRVTAEDIAAAYHARVGIQAMDDTKVARATISCETMPLMSFPWIFPAELGQIATSRSPHGASRHPNTIRTEKVSTRAEQQTALAKSGPEPLPEIMLGNIVVHDGEDLIVFQQDESWTPESAPGISGTACLDHSGAEVVQTSHTNEVSVAPVAASSLEDPGNVRAEKKQERAQAVYDSSDDAEMEVVVLNANGKKSALDNLSQLMGL
nr:rna-dependent rna polymerase 1 [Quercus suber]